MNSAFLGFGSEQALRQIADALADGVFTTDAEGRITYWNRAAQRITGWTAEEAIGTTCALLAGDAVNGCSCGAGPIRCGLATSGHGSKRCTTRTKDGQHLVIVKSAAPVRDASGNAIGALEAFTPVKHDPLDAETARCGLGGLTGRHPAMLELYRTMKAVAASTATVMISGESGSGKDLVAEAIHALGPRSARPLVRVPCAALDALLATDGSMPRQGRSEGAHPFDQARGGTLLLEAIGELSASAQVKLRSFLEQLEARRSTAPSDEDCSVRVLCTTHEDLRHAVDEGRFRADLYFRLNVLRVRVPPLREHIEDVPLIAQRLLARRTPPVEMAVETGYALIAHRWPGNVRELVNALECAAVRSAGNTIFPEHLPEEVTATAPAVACDDERAQLAETLARCGGSRMLAARALGISRVTLWKRMKKHGVPLDGGS